MANDLASAGRYTVEGFLGGTWHPVLSANDREAAIRGAGSVTVSGAFDFVRLMLNDATAGRRELVRIERGGTVRNGAFVKPLPDERPAPEISRPVSAGLRPPVTIVAAALTVFAVGIAFGRWAVQVI